MGAGLGAGAVGTLGGEWEGGVRGRAWGVGARGPSVVVVVVTLVTLLLVVVVVMLVVLRTGLLLQGRVLGRVLQVGSTHP